eukprot:363437-Chlamydomonas_euryale.AAC.8
MAALRYAAQGGSPHSGIPGCWQHVRSGKERVRRSPEPGVRLVGLHKRATPHLNVRSADSGASSDRSCCASDSGHLHRRGCKRALRMSSCDQARRSRADTIVCSTRAEA